MSDAQYLVIDSLSRNDIDRLFKRIEINHKTGCWNWTGATIKNRGYGAFRYKRQTVMVHRIMFAWRIGPIPLGRGRTVPVLDHFVCDNPRCANPEHLRIVFQRENVLRGSNPPANNARKIYCSRGHKLPEFPNEIYGNNRMGRRCVECRKINARHRKT